MNVPNTLMTAKAKSMCSSPEQSFNILIHMLQIAKQYLLNMVLALVPLVTTLVT